METFNHVCEEIENLNEKYLEHENESYFQAMEDSWMKIITKGKIFNDFSYLSAFDLKFLKFKIRQYQILYLKVIENNDIESAKTLSNFIIMLRLELNKFKSKILVLIFKLFFDL